MSNVSLKNQLRVLARGERLNNVVLVRTLGDKDPKKSKEHLERDLKQFQDKCKGAQKGLGVPEVAPLEHFQVITAPAVNGHPAEVDIAGPLRVLKTIGQKQEDAVRNLVNVADGEVSN